jgi:hypothetical protein
MAWLEIIEIRSVGVDKDIVQKQLSRLIDEMGDLKSRSFDIYYNTKIDTDFNIQLFHKTENVEHKGSSIGQHLVSFFKEFGLVNHRIWEEFKGNHQL